MSLVVSDAVCKCFCVTGPVSFHFISVLISSELASWLYYFIYESITESNFNSKCCLKKTVIIVSFIRQPSQIRTYNRKAKEYMPWWHYCPITSNVACNNATCHFNFWSHDSKCPSQGLSCDMDALRENKETRTRKRDAWREIAKDNHTE